MAKLTQTVIAPSASGKTIDSNVSFQLFQKDSGGSEVDLLRTRPETGAYTGSSDGSVLVGDGNNFPSPATAGIPREKIDVEGAVRAFEFIDDEGREISFLLDKLLPNAELLTSYSSTNGVNGGKVGFDLLAGESDSTFSVGGVGDYSNISIGDSFNRQGNTGTRQGIIGTNKANVGGTLNFNIAGNVNYPDDSFGRAREGKLQLQVDNGSGWTTVPDTDANLSNGSVGSDAVNSTTTGNGTSSGFDLSASANVEFADGSDFDGDQYRTGTWNLNEDDYFNSGTNSAGFFAVRIIHLDDTGSVISSTNDILYLYDSDTTDATFSSTSFSSPNTDGSKNLSGVTFHTEATATVQATVTDLYKWSYDGSNNAVTFPLTINCTIPNKPITAPSSVSDSFDLNATATADVDFIINDGFEATIKIEDPINSAVTSGSFSDFAFLVDTTSATNTDDLFHNFQSENKRVKGNVGNWNTLASNDAWDSAVSLTGTSTAHNDGLQVIGGQLVYPTMNFESTVITDGPVNNNRDYSTATGVRTYYGYATNPSATANFGIKINGTGTIVDTGAGGAPDLTTGTDELHFEIRVGDDDVGTGSGTGWLDINKGYSAGSIDDGDGCFTSGNTSRSLNGDPIGTTVGNTVSTASFNDYMFFKVTYPENGTAVLDDVTIVWGG